MLNTTLCHIEKNGKYLMLHRIKKENDQNKDKWVAIGGKFEEGESPEECNRREVFEETGLILGKTKYCGIVTFISDKWQTEYMHIFHSSDFSGTEKTCDEGELCWVDKKEIYNLPIWQGDKIFLKLLEQDTPFFSLKLEYKGERLVKASLNEKEIDVTHKT